MLDPAQEDISPAEVVDRLGADPVVGVKALEHVEGARSAHLGPAAAEDELLRLDEELDLADAAAPELDVVAGNDDPLVAADGVDLALHRVDVGDRRIVEILAPDERREIGEKPLAELEVARGRARLDQSGALPVLADGLVVGIGAQGRQRDRGRGGIGPQAKVDPEHVAVARPLLQEPSQRLGHAHKQRPRLGSWWNGGRGRIVEDNKVNIARIIELARAHFAERQHDHAAVPLQIRRVRIEHQESRARVPAQKEHQCGADSGVGEAGQGLGRGDDIPDAADVGERDQECRFALGAAQRPHQVRLVLVAPLGERLNEGIERFTGRTPQEPGEPRWVVFGQRPQVGRMIGEAEQQVARPAELGREDRSGRRFDERSETVPGFGRRAEPRRVGEAVSERCGHS